jgi:hypothetical protein
MKEIFHGKTKKTCWTTYTHADGIFCWNEFRLHTFQIMCDIHPPFKKAAIRNFIKLKKKNKICGLFYVYVVLSLK